jgi:2-C-methyl-D-erythritol 4-phosphate cytidylyltransferase
MLSAILVAAGSSRRMGFDKLFAEIAGRPVIGHSILAFERTKSVDEIIVVTRQDRQSAIEEIVRCEKLKKVGAIVRGGEHRHDSVRAGLDQVSAAAKYVAVHDAARCLIEAEQIERVFEKCREAGAATLAEPIRDTVKRADSDLWVTGSVDRQQLYSMQTPQVFERKLLEEAYRLVAERKLTVTDEVSAVELLGHKVALVVNEEFNFKITYSRDLALADCVLRERNIARGQT